MKIYVFLFIFGALILGGTYLLKEKEYQSVKEKVYFNEVLNDKELKLVKKREKIKEEDELLDYLIKKGNKKNYRVLIEAIKNSNDLENRIFLIEKLADDLEKGKDQFQALKIFEEIKELKINEKEKIIIDEKLRAYYMNADMFDKLEKLEKENGGSKK